MRLAEKTIELNWCAQLNEFLGRRVIWFGLTQKQECEAGFDAYMRLGGAMLVFQFEASNYMLASGKRRFYSPHHQVVALRSLGQQRRRSVFYVFPMIGNTVELSANTDLIGSSQLLDAGAIPNGIGPPIGKNGQPRKSNRHYFDLVPGLATIHSDPVTVPTTTAMQAIDMTAPTSAGGEVGRVVAELDATSTWLRQVRRRIRHGALGAVILPAAP